MNNELLNGVMIRAIKLTWPTDDVYMYMVNLVIVCIITEALHFQFFRKKFTTIHTWCLHNMSLKMKYNNLFQKIHVKLTIFFRYIDLIAQMHKVFH